jgi:EamA domain-containing membrane protein RarD
VTILWTFALLAIYVRLLFKTERVPTDKKTLWAVVLFLGNMLAMPVFWYLYVWREPESEAKRTAGGYAA